MQNRWWLLGRNGTVLVYSVLRARNVWIRTTSVIRMGSLTANSAIPRSMDLLELGMHSLGDQEDEDLGHNIAVTF